MNSAVPAAALRPRFSDLLRSEWIKLASLPATWGALIGMIVLGIAGAVLSGLRYTGVSVIREVDVALTMYDVTMVAGALCPVFAGIVGVLAFGSEYASGSIQSTFLAAPNRVRVLLAKALVLCVTVGVAAVVLSFGAWGASYPIYAQFGLHAPLDAEVLSSLLGVACYLALVAVFGVGVTALVRSTTTGTIIIFAATFLVPMVTMLLPAGLPSVLIRGFVIGNGGYSMVAMPIADAPFANLHGYLSPTAGYLIVMIWTLVALLAGAVALRKKDV